MYTNQHDLKNMIKSRAQYQSHEAQALLSPLFSLVFIQSRS